jgi:hypothetical protein
MLGEMPMTLPSDTASCVANTASYFEFLNSLQLGKWLFPTFGLFVVLILALAGWKQWTGFAFRHKWTSRVLLFTLTLVLAICLHLIVGWAFQNIPTRFAFESPNMTSTAFKLGIYGLVIGHEENLILPKEKNLLDCVHMLSVIETQNHAKDCDDDQVCIETMPVLKHKDIIDKIKESQNKNIPLVSTACKDVDVSKL